MNGKTTYQAKIIKPDGYPLEAAVVNFKFMVLDAAAACVLYSENYSNIDMRSTGGLISFALGNGIRDFPASGTTAIFANVFDNSITSMPCQVPGIYNPQPSDSRRVVMQFNDGTGWQTLPAMTINDVPYAMYASKANEAKTLNGKVDSAFVEYSTLASLNCNSSTEAITFNGVSFSCVTLGSASSGVSSVTTSGSVLVTAGTSATPVISIQAATLSQDGYLTSLDYADFKAKLSASATQIVNTLGFAPVSGAAVTSQIASSTLSGDVSGNPGSNTVNAVGGKSSSQISTSVDDILAATASATTSRIVKRDASGNSSFSGLSAVTANLNYVDIYKPSSSFNIRLQAPTGLSSNYILNLPTASGTIGQVLSTDGNGNLSWINPSTGSVVSVSAITPLASTGGSTPTISITQANSSTAGYLSATDWSTFNNKQQATSSAIIATLGYAPADISTLTSGSVVFVNSSGALAEDNSQFFWDNSNKRLGIGTTNPTAKLNLSSGTMTVAPLKFTSGTLLSSAQAGTMEYDGSQYYLTDGTNTRRAIATGSSVGTIDNASNINSTGNITLTPVGSVIVSATATSTSSQTGALVVRGGLGVAGNIFSSGTIVTSSNIQGASITATSGISTNVIQGNTNLLLNPNGGNVGIGTGAPTTKLDVAGNIFSNQNDIIYRKATSGSGSTATELIALSNFGIISHNDNTVAADTSTISSFAASRTTTTVSIRNAGTGAALTVPAGNVGIGTTSPASKLTISRATEAASNQLELRNEGGITVGNYDGLRFTQGTTGATPLGSFRALYQTNGAPDLAFYTRDVGLLTESEKMRILNNGNVGIGTTTPQNKLMVVGVAGLPSNSENPEASLLVRDGGNNWLGIGNSNSGNWIQSSQPGIAGPAFNLLLNPAGGNVGIGTSAPTSILHLSSGDTTGTQFKISNTDGNGATVGFISTGSANDGGVGNLRLDAPFGTPRMIVTSGGAVGIGTTAPSGKLDINGSSTGSRSVTKVVIGTANNAANATADGLTIQRSGTSGVISPALILSNYFTNNIAQDTIAIDFRAGDGGGVGFGGGRIAYASAGGGTDNFNISTAATTNAFNILSNGNVGVGITNPTEKLHVDGKIKASSFFTSTTSYTQGVNAGDNWVRIASGQANSYADLRIEGATSSQHSFMRLVASCNFPNGSRGDNCSVNILQKSEHAETNFKGVRIVKMGTYDPYYLEIQLGNNPGAETNIKVNSLDNSGFTILNSPVLGNIPVGYDAITVDTSSTLFRVGNGQLNIAGNGNVGIGTTVPNGLLDVRGGVTVGTLGKWGVRDNASGSQFAIEYHNGGAFSDANIKMVVNSAGNVGIGTVTPDSKLSVDASQSVLNDSGMFRLDDPNYPIDATTGRPGLSFGYDNSSDMGWIYSRRRGKAGTPLNLNATLYVQSGNGNVGIGTTAPSEKLHVVGNLRVQGTTDCTLGNGAGGTNCSSDARLKENIKPIPYALEKINSLKGVEFDWNTLSRSQGRHDIGVIAQDVEKVFPTAVVNDQNTGYKKVDYAVLVAPLIQAVKELYLLVTDQDRKLASVREQTDLRILQLEKENKALKGYLCAKDPAAGLCK